MKIDNRTTNPDEHIKNMEAILNYRGVRGPVKYRLFSLTLKREVLTWKKILPRGFINSLEELCHQFISSFITS